MRMALATFIAALTLACGPTVPDKPRIEQSVHARAKNVLIVYNKNEPDSLEIVKAYQQARGVPDSNVVAVNAPAENNMGWSEYERDVRDVVRAHVSSKRLEIDFLLLIRGMPLRLNNDGGYGLDAFLAVDAHPSRVEKPLEPMPMSNFTEQDFRRIMNPYFRAAEPFSAKKYGYYLTTRLDGYTVRDAISLIARASSAKPETGDFLLDAAPDKVSGGYAVPQDAMKRARDVLEKKGYSVALDEGAAFVGGRVNLMGYASWGSNDGAFRQTLYSSLQFRPGSIGETFVSTSARTFRPTAGGQSLIADLIAQGITGVKGYASEPYTMALAYVDILFDRYTSGYTLAESFYCASMMLKWKDVVIGDPLCAPYAK
jgi:uncharacterized protein (TIGR03790 family)